MLLRLRETLLLVLTGFVSLQMSAQTNGPLSATRWEQGAAWLPDGSIDDSPSSGPINGIIRCGSAAEAQSQIGPTATYDPAVFEIVLPPSGCINPSSGEEVIVVPPTTGEPVIWLNFDVRAYSGVYEIQINDNSGDAIGWALYASTSPTSAVEQNPETGEWLSGNPNELMFLSCGVESSASWNALPVPQFNVPTNCYLAIWDQDADGDINLSNFKARFGCGDSGAPLCSVSVSEVTTSCVDGEVHAEVTVEGVNGLYQIQAPTAEVIQGSEGVCLATPGTEAGIQGYFTLVFASGAALEFDVVADVQTTACEVATNASECAVTYNAPGVVCPIPGCSDPCACNFDALANEDDGSCFFDCHGCIYASALNYDATAVLDDGSCVFSGCMHAECFTFDGLANFQAEGTCDNPSGFADFNGDGAVAVSDVTTMLQVFMTSGPEWGGNEWVLDACEGSSSDETENATLDPGNACVNAGCLYPQALNFNPSASHDSGVCLFAGCTDSTALNFSPHANIDDGSCAFQWCPDFNRNGAVQVNDLMSILSVYGLMY